MLYQFIYLALSINSIDISIRYGYILYIWLRYNGCNIILQMWWCHSLFKYQIYWKNIFVLRRLLYKIFIDKNYRQVVLKNILPDIFSLWFFIIFYNVLLFAKLCCNTFHDTNTWQKLTYFMVTAQITSGEKVCLSKYANFYVWATAVSHKNFI